MLPSKLINWAGLVAVLGGMLRAGLMTLDQIHASGSPYWAK
jgi:hypothetical protein